MLLTTKRFLYNSLSCSLGLLRHAFYFNLDLHFFSCYTLLYQHPKSKLHDVYNPAARNFCINRLLLKLFFTRIVLFFLPLKLFHFRGKKPHFPPNYEFWVCCKFRFLLTYPTFEKKTTAHKFLPVASKKLLNRWMHPDRLKKVSYGMVTEN